MSFRTRIALVVVWLSSLLAVGTLASGQLRGFQFQPLPEPFIVSGDDIGFRVKGLLGGTPAGTLVIRRNGVWIEPQAAPKPSVSPLRAR